MKNSPKKHPVRLRFVFCSGMFFAHSLQIRSTGYYFPTKVPGAQYKVCVLFQRRQCFKGDRCPFRHINERQVLCKHWLRGLCKRGDNCDFAHEYDLNRMQECQFFKNEGQCFPEADHQLLTNRGFLFLDELLNAPCDDLRVASYDPASQQLHYAAPSALVVNDEPRALVEFCDDSQQPLLTATADHEMFVAAAAAPDSWRKQTAASLVGRSFHLLSNAHGGVAVRDSDSYSTHLGFDDTAQMCAYLELYGFWVASGGGVDDETGVTFHAADKREQQFVCDRLATLGVSPVATADDGAAVVVSDAQFIRAYVAAYVHSLAPRARFAEWVWHLPLAPLRAVLDGVGAAQGGAGAGLFASTVRFRDELVRALLHAGEAPTFERWRRGWRVMSLSPASAPPRVVGAAEARSKSAGRTWCVDMSSAPGARDGFVVVRRAVRVSAQQFEQLAAAECELARALETGDDERAASAQCAVRAASTPATGPFDAGEWVVLEASRATIQGNCNNPDCLWKHVTPEDKERAAECQFYARGFCRHGPKCRNKHVKKVLCLNWLAGFCPQGPACEKAHPTIEMMQLLDGSLRVRNTELPACVLCGEDGHTIQTCPQAQQQHQLQYQEQQQQQQQQQQQMQQFQQQQPPMPLLPMHQQPPMHPPPMHQPPMFQQPPMHHPMHPPPMFAPPPHGFQPQFRPY
jgi:hypothetical protein